MSAILNDLVGRLQARLMLLFGVGRLTVSDDSQSIQQLQAEMVSGEVIDQLQRIGEFGFTSRPPDGASVVVAFLGGDRSNGVVLGTLHQPSRLRGLQQGEAALYSEIGQYAWLTVDGIVIEAKGLPVTVNNASAVTVNGTTVTINAATSVDITSPTTTVHGNLVVTQAVQAATVNGTTSVTGAGKSLHTHTHGGVQTGVGTTGVPS